MDAYLFTAGPSEEVPVAEDLGAMIEKVAAGWGGVEVVVVAVSMVVVLVEE